MDDPRVGEQRRNLIRWILTKVLMKPIFWALTYNKTPREDLIKCVTGARKWRESPNLAAARQPYVKL